MDESSWYGHRLGTDWYVLQACISVAAPSWPKKKQGNRLSGDHGRALIYMVAWLSCRAKPLQLVRGVCIECPPCNNQKHQNSKIRKTATDWGHFSGTHTLTHSGTYTHTYPHIHTHTLFLHLYLDGRMVRATEPRASFRMATASAWVRPARDCPFTSRIWSPRRREPSRAAAPRSNTLLT